MFWTCTATQSFLNILQTWFAINNITISFQEKSFIFNTNLDINSSMSSIEFQIILELKYYIFTAKHMNRTLSKDAFKNRLKYIVLSLQEMATQKGELDKFNKQWCKIQNILNQ